MPVEPDNSKVEELLKAYARKRREEGGSTFELHPATRKMLQAEAAREFGKNLRGKRSFFSSLVRFWPRIAFAGAAVVVLSLVLWNMTRQSRKSVEYEMAQAVNEPQQDAEGIRRASQKNDSPVASDKLHTEPRNLLREELAPVRRNTSLSDLAVTQRAPENAPQDVVRAQEKREMQLAEKSRGLGALSEKDVGLRDESEVLLKRSDGLERSKTLSGPAQPSARPSRSAPTLATSQPRPEQLDRLEAGAALAATTQPAKPEEQKLAILAKEQTVTASSQVNTKSGAGGGGGGASFADNQNLYGVPSLQTNGMQTRVWSSTVSGLAAPATSTFALNAATTDSVNAGRFFRALNGVSPPAGGALEFAPTPPPLSAPTEPNATLALAPPAPAAPEPARLPAYSYYFQATNSFARARFANVVPANRTSGGKISGTFAKTTPAQTPQPLYATFDVQQEGQRIRIVDFDGSIYDGRVILTEPTTTRSRTAKEAKQVFYEQRAIDGKPTISFTASGTNRTLRKSVLIKGAMTAAAKQRPKPGASADSKSVADRYSAADDAARFAWAASNDALAETNAFVPGDLDAMVQIDRSAETRVQATRVSP